MVRFLRLALPLAAVGLIGLVLSWPRVEKTLEPIPEQAAMPKAVARNELIAPRFESADTRNRPYTITAGRAVQSAQDPAIVLLDEPAAKMGLKDGARIAIAAKRGAYRQNSEKLFLQGAVHLSYDKGYAMDTDKLLIDLKDRRAWSDSPVSGAGPAGTLEATGLQADAGADRLIFTGPVKLVLKRAIEGVE